MGIRNSECTEYGYTEYEIRKRNTKATKYQNTEYGIRNTEYEIRNTEYGNELYGCSVTEYVNTEY